jgi:GNAT superfamily N-acetyltransferase
MIRAGHLHGEVNTTDSGNSAAVWISPLYDVSVRRMVRAALLSMPFGVASGIARRCLKMAATVEEVRKRLAPVPHWYLMALGLRASQTEKGFGEALIQPVLLRADSAGIPCYLETFSEEKLRFFKSYGFRITGAGRIPGGGPNFWAMTRVA